MTQASVRREISRRWTPGLTVDGWTPISNFFIENYHRLEPRLNHQEVVLVIHLISHKWNDQAPFPSLVRLAKQMGISTTAVRKHARRLESKGYIRREYRSAKTNMFHLDGLFQALEKLRLQEANAAAGIICAKCGTTSDHTASFCRKCGMALTNQAFAAESVF